LAKGKPNLRGASRNPPDRKRQTRRGWRVFFVFRSVSRQKAAGKMPHGSPKVSLAVYAMPMAAAASPPLAHSNWVVTLLGSMGLLR
jgi:hypothetical protein